MKSFFPNYSPLNTVTPTSAEEVQELIKQANQTKSPLVPFSSGTNLQDTHLPSVKNATVVDLSKMNRILHLDPKNRNAVVEPGVTFRQLQKACEEMGLRTLTAIDVSQDASVLSTYLEMMPLFGWPKYHPWEMLTMKGFRADGEIFATGQMAMKQERPDKYSWGVSFAQVARLFCQAQGTLGIITSAAVTLKTATPYNQVLFFTCKTANQTTKALRGFVATEEPHEIFAVNKVYLEDLLGQKNSPDFAPWTIVLIIRGFEKDELVYKRNDLKDVAKNIADEFATDLKSSKKAAEKILEEIQLPTGPALHNNGKCWVPIVTMATAGQIKECEALLPKDSGTIVMPLQAGGGFYYQPGLRYEFDELEKTRKTYINICNNLLQSGAMFPRPSALIAQKVAMKYPDNTTLLRSIKKAVDPNNIMNPGKLGM